MIKQVFQESVRKEEERAEEHRDRRTQRQKNTDAEEHRGRRTDAVTQRQRRSLMSHDNYMVICKVANFFIP